MLQNERTLKQKIADLEAQLADSRNRIIQLENELELAKSRPVEKFDAITIQTVETVQDAPDGFGFGSEEVEQLNQDKMALTQRVSSQIF